MLEPEIQPFSQTVTHRQHSDPEIRSRIVAVLSEELRVLPQKILAAIALLDDGATVPFIARYRKEATGGLNDTQLRALATRLEYMDKLEERKSFIIKRLESQGRLTPALQANIVQTQVKQALEDLYLPYKPKRRTRAERACAAGLLPLAELLLTDRTKYPQVEAASYIQEQDQTPHSVAGDTTTTDLALKGRATASVTEEGVSSKVGADEPAAAQVLSADLPLQQLAGDDQVLTAAGLGKRDGAEEVGSSSSTQSSSHESEGAANVRASVVSDVKAALEGARDILAERFSERADVLGALREQLWETGVLYCTVREGKQVKGAKFRDYFDYSEPIRTIPSHRVFAILRGRKLGILRLRLGMPMTSPKQEVHPCLERLLRLVGLSEQPDWGLLPADEWLLDVCAWCWSVKLSHQLEAELVARLREIAEAQAVQVFGQNLKDLLLQPPAGPKRVLGLDPGIRTGVKLAVIDETGGRLETTTIYPHPPRKEWEESLSTLADLVRRHKVELVAVGNGTASRETDRLVGELLKKHPEFGLHRLMVSEAGASVYSASEVAVQEFPDLDVSLRSAVSIARRVQDPLAELVKIDPKSVGVGQYQHDVSQRLLGVQLDAVVEDCVNAVGVDVNTASAELLSHVSGLNKQVAQNIVSWRTQNGAFQNRMALRQVPSFGEKTFEQAGGFLRVQGGSDPLDASAVHPEAYEMVAHIAQQLGCSIAELMGQEGLLAKVDVSRFVNEKFGEATLRDVLLELERPSRDPRGVFVPAPYREGVETLKDLLPGMQLEGVVTNVTRFGAFVDIGVHQDGLVHVSALANRFVREPHEVVKVGQVVSVRVLEVDEVRRRISLTMKSLEVLQERAVRPSYEKREGSVSTADSPKKSREKPVQKPSGETPSKQRVSVERSQKKERVGRGSPLRHSALLGEAVLGDALAQAIKRGKVE